MVKVDISSGWDGLGEPPWKGTSCVSGLDSSCGSGGPGSSSVSCSDEGGASGETQEVWGVEEETVLPVSGEEISEVDGEGSSLVTAAGDGESPGPGLHLNEKR